MKNEERLFRDITDALHAHEDAYIDGAWETFVQKKKRKRFPVYMRLAGAAALLIIFGYAALLYVPKTTPKKSQKYQAKNNIRPNQSKPKATTEDQGLAKVNIITPENIRNENATESAGNNRQKTKPLLYSSDKKNLFEAPFKAFIKDSDNIAVNNFSKKDPAADDLLNKAEPGLPDVVSGDIKRYDKTARLSYDSLAGLKKPEKATIKRATGREAFSYAIQLSPSLGNERMNFGTGIEVGYKLSKNFSVSTGIGYSYVNAGSNRGASSPEALQSNVSNSFASAMPSSKYSPATSQTVKGVRLALSGFEVPLNFQYKTKSGFYLSAGIAALSIVGNDLSYNYLNTRGVSSASANGMASTISIVSEESNEKSTENIRGYVGFYTFSAGKKITIGRKQLKFAPFVKIPFTGVSSEKIQLVHGGVQLGIAF